jgi:hypothetical protein
VREKVFPRGEIVRYSLEFGGAMPDTRVMVERKTLLEAVWESGDSVEEISARLESGQLELTGNFKGRELEIARDAIKPEAGDWERK